MIRAFILKIFCLCFLVFPSMSIAQVAFEDITEAAGIGSPGESGIAWFDYNNDGWLDLLVLSDIRSDENDRARLFWNDRGVLKDVTQFANFNMNNVSVLGAAIGDGGLATDASGSFGQCVYCRSEQSSRSACGCFGCDYDGCRQWSCWIFWDSGLAINAQLREPVSVFVDKSGIIFIADRGNAVVRKVFSNGIVTTVAGNRLSGFDSDWGMATEVRLDDPAGVFVDRRGDLYIADQGNDRIRWVEQVGGGVPNVAVGAADFNGDLRVDFLDFLTFAKAFGSSDSTHDLNGNGAVDFPDFLAFAQAFGQVVE